MNQRNIIHTDKFIIPSWMFARENYRVIKNFGHLS